MVAQSEAAVVLETFQEEVAEAIKAMPSLDAITAWLTSQQRVKSVRLADYLLKSNPPQRDFIVEFEVAEGATITLVVNVLDQGNKQFQLHRLREA